MQRFEIHEAGRVNGKKSPKFNTQETMIKCMDNLSAIKLLKNYRKMVFDVCHAFQNDKKIEE